MPVSIIVGAQWGDEGKGKIVDHLSEKVDIVARYQGGANAGHTVILPPTRSKPSRQFILHLIPSGIFHTKVTCVIGNGVVIDPVALMEEINQLKSAGIRVDGRLLISHNAHLIMPYHKMLDSLREEGSHKIGTTGRGIGPAYIDKYMRTGIRVVDLLDIDSIVKEYQEFDRLIDPYITDTTDYLNVALAKGKHVLAEGAQGALLDVDHGTYPFVTSSNPTSGGACTGLGIPPTHIRKITGVAKAYCTRVGNGPFPTELHDATGDQIRKTGGEFGATTGRPRRCGWLDIVSLSYSVRVNGIQSIAMTKLDVLDDFDEIRVCVAYTIGGKTVKRFSTDTSALDDATPVYRTFKGWKARTSDIRSFKKLPAQARAYIRAVEKLLGTRISMVSVGARRDQSLTVPRG
jgi:adenylosuccinate synthase